MSQRLQTQKAMQSMPISVPPIAVAACTALSDPCMYKMQVTTRTHTISTPKTKGRQLFRTALTTTLLANLCLLMGFREEWGRTSILPKFPLTENTFPFIRLMEQSEPSVHLRSGRYFDANKAERSGGGYA